MARTSKTENAILGLLGLSPMSGYDMKAFISQSIGFFWHESYGQIYPTLNRLLKARLVTRHVSTTKGRPDRHVYSITDKGRQQVSAWLEADTEPERIRNEMLLKLFLGPMTTPDVHMKQIERLLRSQLDRLDAFSQVEKGLLRQYKDTPGYPYFRASLRFGVHLTRARVAWCRETLSMLRKQKKT